MSRFYDKEEFNEITNKFQNGGILYFIERLDTNEFYYEPMMFKKSSMIYENVGWTKEIGLFTLTGAFLNKESAEKEIEYLNLTEGGCGCCGNGSHKIETKVTEHEFIPNP